MRFLRASLPGLIASVTLLTTLRAQVSIEPLLEGTIKDSAALRTLQSRCGPNDSLAWWLTAALLHNLQNDHQGAIAAAEKASQFRVNGREKLLIHRIFSAAYASTQDHERGIPHSRYVIKHGGKYPGHVAHAYLNIASAKRHYADYDSALILISRAGKIFRETGDEHGLGIVYLNKGSVMYYLGEVDSAAECCFTAISIFEKHGDLMNLARAYNNLSQFMHSIGESEKARFYLSESISIRKQINDQIGMANCYVTYGNFMLTREQWDSAQVYFERALGVFRQFGGKRGILWVLNNIGNAAYYSGDVEKAKGSFKAALNTATELQDSLEICRLHANLGWTFLQQKKLDSALIMFRESVRIGERIDPLEPLEQAWEGMADYFIAVGDHKQALDAYVKSREIHEQILNEKRIQQANELEARFQNERKERTILKLKAMHAEASLEVARQRFTIAGLVVLMVLIFSTVGFIYYRRKKRTEIELAKREAEHRKRLLDATVKAQEEAQQRIAQDLHDGLVQTIAAAKINLQSALRKLNLHSGIEDELKQGFAILDDAADEARELSHQKMPRALIKVGLLMALDEMLQKNLGSRNIDYEFEHFGINDREIDGLTRVNLFRIAQELINNIVKHSESKSIVVQLFKAKNNLVLRVEDDGKGFDFDVRQPHRGMGIDNIFSRASVINAEVDFSPRPGGGTIVTVRVPLGERPALESK
ncbi:MAG: hypothetical protein Kow0075_02930 [Salibacteraceae bacterium]